MSKAKNIGQVAKTLKKYTPNEYVAKQFAQWVVEYGVHLRITPERKSKLGDYRAPVGGQRHRISINGTLNPYAFTITFIHEVAHLKTWLRYLGRVSHHGAEWKREFRQLMKPFLKNGVAFPEDVRLPLAEYMQEPGASSCGDPRLYIAISAYDEGREEGWIHLCDLPIGDWFEGKSGIKLQKLCLLRKNYRCEEYGTGRLFTAPPQMLIKPIDPPKDHDSKKAISKQRAQQLSAQKKAEEREYRQWLGLTTLDQIPEGELFADHNGVLYRKGKKLRKNFECIEISSGQKYRIGPKYPVKLIKA